MPTDILSALEAAHREADRFRSALEGRISTKQTTVIMDHLPALLAIARAAREISLSGMEPDDARLDYYTVQVDKREWDALRAALAALESPEGGRDGE